MTKKRVVTERDVRRAAQQGAKTLDAQNAVVTPSARDAAVLLKVALLRGGDDTGGEGAPPREKVTTDSRSPSHQDTADATAPAPAPLAIALGADHGGVQLKDVIAARLRELRHGVTDLGTTGSDAVDYPDFAVAVAREVADGRAQFGIMVDGAGIGSCMTANKVSGVRAAMCYDLTTAVNAREHNNANVLTLGGGLIGTRLALAIVEAFLATPFAGGRHAARVAKIDALD